MQLVTFALFFQCALSSTPAPVEHQAGPDPEKYKPVYEVFGAAEQIVAMNRMSSSKAFAQRAVCSYPIEALFLLDSSGSMTAQEFTYVQEVLPQFAASLLTTHPGSTLSLASFEDKPIETLGELTDHCLTPQIIYTTNLAAFNTSLQSIVVGGGYDWPETQLSAIVASMNSPNSLGWTRRAEAVPVIFLITDAAFHYAEDSSAADYPQLTPWADAPYNENAAQQYCLNTYYPDPFMGVEALSSTFLAMGIVNPDLYDRLALRSYQWFNTLLEQPDEMVKPLSADLSAWMTDFTSMVDTIDSLVCSVSSTQAPGTSAAATQTTAALGTSAAAAQTTAALGSSAAAAQTTAALSTTTATTDLSQGPVASTSEDEECACSEGESECCWKQPEVLIALMKRPSEFDVHYKA